MIGAAFALLLAAQDKTIDDFEGELNGWSALKLDNGTVDPDADSKIEASAQGPKSGRPPSPSPTP